MIVKLLIPFENYPEGHQLEYNEKSMTRDLGQYRFSEEVIASKTHLFSMEEEENEEDNPRGESGTFERDYFSGFSIQNPYNCS